MNNTGLSGLRDIISLNLSADPHAEQQLRMDLTKMKSSAYTQMMSSDENYCFRFNLPISAVNKLYNVIGVSQQQVYDAFKKDWGAPAMTNNMYASPYYQILLAIIYYSENEGNKQLSEDALLVILFKIWNGRKSKFLKYCNKRIMRYVVSHMCTNRNLFAKHDSPLSMIRDHFVPTLLKTYGHRLKNDTFQLQRLLSQAWSRIHQQFVTNLRTNVATGQREAQGGIMMLYKRAKEEGLAIGSTAVTSIDDENTPTFDQYTTTSNRDEIISTSADFITMNPNPTYSPNVISELNKTTKVSAKAIQTILKSLHDYSQYDVIHDILSVVLSRTNVIDKSDICKPTYSALVKRNVISSKNNADSRKLQQLCDNLLDHIFKKKFQKSFKAFSNVQQIQLRTVVVQGIVYNLKRNVCRSQMIDH